MELGGASLVMDSESHSNFLLHTYIHTYFVFWIANPLRLTACDLDNMIGMQKYLNYLPKVEFPIQYI